MFMVKSPLLAACLTAFSRRSPLAQAAPSKARNWRLARREVLCAPHLGLEGAKFELNRQKWRF